MDAAYDGRSQELAGLGTATLAESGARPLAPGLGAVWAGSTLAAPLFPVWCPADDNLSVHHAVVTAPPGAALVVATGGAPERGWWGEVLTTAAMARRLAGLVIDACVRDTAAITTRRFPVWAQGVALSGTGKTQAGHLGASVEIRGATAEAGDWVVADGDGVVIVPGAAIGAVVAAGHERTAREARWFDELAAGRTTIELIGLDPPP